MSAPRRRGREAMLALASMGVATALFLGAAEILLRFLPVATGMRTVPVTDEQPVLHFAPDREFLYSRDWDMTLVNRGRTNNAGYVNDQPYRRDDPRPMLAVIGDSYVHAAMVAYPLTVQGRLAQALEGKRRVYSFAASGAPLSQYLIWARTAVKDWGADRLAIVVVGNDFDESHIAYKTGPGFWLYAPEADGSLKLALQEYRPGQFRDMALHSALVRYMLFNLGVGPHLLRLAPTGIAPAAAQTTGPYAGNTGVSTDATRMSISRAVVEAFFRDLPAYTDLPPGRILFVLDGLRYPASAAAAQETYFGRMRQMFQDEATKRGYLTVDMDRYFLPRFAATGERYEWPQDGHWNPLGHELAAQAVLESPLLKD